MQQPVELVLRNVLGQPVALVLSEVQHLGDRVEVHSDHLPDAVRHDLHAAAVEIDAAELCVGRRWHADVAGRADVEIQLVVGPDGQELPAMRFIARQIVIDDGRLGRIVELGLDIVDLRDLVELGDVERAVVQRYAVRPPQAGEQRLDLVLAVLVDDRIDPVERAGADEQSALVIDPERARLRHPAGIDLDVEIPWHLQHGDRELVEGRCERRRHLWREVHRRGTIGPALRPGRRRRLCGRGGLLRRERPGEGKDANRRRNQNPSQTP